LKTLQLFRAVVPSSNEQLYVMKLSGVRRVVLLRGLAEAQGSTILASSGHLPASTAHRGRHKMVDSIGWSVTATHETRHSERHAG